MPSRLVSDITTPAGLVVDDVLPRVDADYGFASYQWKTEVQGKVIHYSRTFELKELSVPVAKADELRKFYRLIAGDECNTVMLKTEVSSRQRIKTWITGYSEASPALLLASSG